MVVTNPREIIQAPPVFDLLVDVKYPRNIGVRVNDVEDRLDSLERFYGNLANHSDLDNLTNDDHPQYPLGISTKDRRAQSSDHLQNISGNKFSVGSGAPIHPGGIAPRVGDGFLRTDSPTVVNQRLYICTVGGSSPTWIGII